MTQDEVYAALSEVMRDVFDDDDLVIGPDTSAEDVVGWDSQAHITLIVATEQQFGVRFRTAEFEALHNVGELVDLIMSKLEHRK
jgi:acyl carrier protein